MKKNTYILYIYMNNICIIYICQSCSVVSDCDPTDCIVRGILQTGIRVSSPSLLQGIKPRIDLPAMYKIWIRSLGRENPLEKGGILAWRVPWTEDPGGL